MFKSLDPQDIANANGSSITKPEAAQNIVDDVNGGISPSSCVTNDVLQQRVTRKEQSLEDIKNQCSDSDEDPEAIVKKHISQLKKYNELKDIALGLVTMIADQRKLRTTDILEEMRVEIGDD
ncbi:uncharacterized protein PRCAT00001527001 [Priceomyces carsonii]|uniref:uncharacterized protein n=1 Tax=Priceomyces carsonii TaxID=28549 RepID=UPI002EDB6E9E|nr:unnamed protein product [Priceomyces carsonii]